MKLEGTLEDIKSRLDIIEIISDYVTLKKAGQNYKGLCPFHSEKTPSFMVSPSKQIFHCFGCGAGGDIAGFMMKYENLSFHEALKLLAKKAGIKLKEYSFKESTERDTVKAIQKEALNLFAENLKRSKAAQEYLSMRGLSEDTARQFSLGSAATGWHTLYERLKGKFPESLILQSGLVSTGQKGVYDNFRARIMFPIFDTYGDVIAFGGRVMDDAMPKYLNSPDTMLFKKSENLYSLNMALGEIRKKGYAIAVEGYLDVIMCHQNEFKNTVAPLGTALTSGQVKKLSRFTKDILLIFDGDEAGVSAAKRAIPIIIEHNIKPRVLILPQGSDPDSILRQKSAEYMSRLIEKASSFIDFILKTSRSGKTDAVRDVLAIIARVDDTLVREELMTELSERSRIRELALREGLKQILKPQHMDRQKIKVCPYNEELLLLSVLISYPEKKEIIFKDITPQDIKDSLLRKIFTKAVSSGENISLLSDEAGDEEKALIRRLSLEPGFEPEDVDRNIEDCMKRIKKRILDETITAARTEGNIRLLNDLLTKRKNL